MLAWPGTRWLAWTKLAEGERSLEAAGVENEIAAFGNFLTTHDF